MRVGSAGVLRLAIGGGLIATSVLALAAPLATGTWSLQLLSLLPFVVGLNDLYTAVRTPETRTHIISYLRGILAIASAVLLFLSPALVVAGVILVLLAFLAVNGALNIGQAVLGRDARIPRAATAINGASNVLLALIGWFLWRKFNVELAIGIAIAGYTAAAGWQILMSPRAADNDAVAPWSANAHPDPLLHLGEHEQFGAAHSLCAARELAVRRAEGQWLFVASAVLFVTHLARMQSSDTWLGLISPFVATVGDALMAVLIGALLLLPLRLGWRRLTRPLERKAWQLRFSGQDQHMNALPRRLVRQWTDARFAFAASVWSARVSLKSAANLVLRLGLPFAVLFVAVNPIWGFTWYFNTESWASGIYQKMTALRVDKWRASMVDAVRSAYGGYDAGTLFHVTPPGIGAGDFSFLIIGDPGEGDASQYSLANRYLELGRREDVKFLIIASDVIYPAGAMVNYENNFYLPFKGFSKPIYAIPGNHDWFDALEGFNANFLEATAARAALSARARADLNLTSTDRQRIDRLLSEAQRLRELYGIQNGLQRSPFFELQTSDFALLAIDTGILRTIDDRQRAWLDEALERARGKFTMAIVGHPKYAAGHDTSEDNAAIAALYATLDRAGIPVLIAGDTHDFEYYVEERSSDDARGARHNFVNGGGGAYLSIGGALAWPEAVATKTWAFYPSAAAIRAKLDAETPAWKQPFWWWIKRFGAWPLDIETLSGMFDFNRAPFYQSFMEVRVERSKKQVLLLLHGVNGPVRWRDLHVSPGAGFVGKPDEPIRFTVEMTGIN
jgi:hypothetical protein